MSLAEELRDEMAEGSAEKSITVLEADYLDRANLNFNGLKRFRKLAEEARLDVTLGASLSHERAELYASTNKTGRAGEVKRPARDLESVWALALAPDRSFAAWAHWEGGTLLVGRYGGPATGEVLSALQITPILNALKAHAERATTQEQSA